MKINKKENKLDGVSLATCNLVDALPRAPQQMTHGQHALFAFYQRLLVNIRTNFAPCYHEGWPFRKAEQLYGAPFTSDRMIAYQWNGWRGPPLWSDNERQGAASSHHDGAAEQPASARDDLSSGKDSHAAAARENHEWHQASEGEKDGHSEPLEQHPRSFNHADMVTLLDELQRRTQDCAVSTGHREALQDSLLVDVAKAVRAHVQKGATLSNAVAATLATCALPAEAMTKTTEGHRKGHCMAWGTALRAAGLAIALLTLLFFTSRKRKAWTTGAVPGFAVPYIASSIVVSAGSEVWTYTMRFGARIARVTARLTSYAIRNGTCCAYAAGGAGLVAMTHWISSLPLLSLLSLVVGLVYFALSISAYGQRADSAGFGISLILFAAMKD